MTTAVTVRYLTVDSLQEGVGASQVLPYATGLAARGLRVELHTFEKSPPPPGLREELMARGVTWHPEPFGRLGARGGLRRVLDGARRARGARLVHARSDLPAASTLIGRPDRWLWDVRSLFADQRVALGTLRPGSPEDRVLRRVEGAAAARSDAIVTLTRAVVDVLAARHGEQVRAKAHVIPTCVDLERFPLAALPPQPVVLMLSGTMNAYYDLALMLRFAARVGELVPTRLSYLGPKDTSSMAQLRAAGCRIAQAAPTEVPSHLAAAHAGLSVCRFDAGISLKAAMPTKIAEFLATGRPVVVNRGLGDMDDLLADSGAGVVLDSPSSDSVDRGAHQLLALLDDNATPDRCRALAERHFSLKQGVDRLASMHHCLWQA